MEKKKIIIISVIVLVVVALIGGGSYAWFNYFQVSNLNNLLVAGDIRLKLQAGQDTLSLSNVFPESPEEARSHEDNTLTFEVNGANTVGKAIKYEILLNHGADIANKTRFKDDELCFDLVEIVDNNEVLLAENIFFDTISNTSIYDNIVPGNTSSVNHTYKLRMWVAEDVIVSETETGSRVYTPSEYKDLYATIKIVVKGETIEGNSYTVTFDPDGGTVGVSTKSVVVGQDYGYLPIPTKEGYVFRGWNGKNLIYNSNQNITINNHYYIDMRSEPAILLSANTDYVLSFKYKVNSASNSVYPSVGYGDNSFSRDIISGSTYTGEGISSVSFTTPATFDYNPPYAWFRFVRMNTSGNADVDVSDIQLEYGNTATEYEPYFILSDTKVVQTNNHTLKAIWQPYSG